MSVTETTTAVKADSEDLIIAGWTFHANAYQIERGGKRIKLEPKATLVLAHLARYAGQPVSREVSKHLERAGTDTQQAAVVRELSITFCI